MTSIVCLITVLALATPTQSAPLEPTPLEPTPLEQPTDAPPATPKTEEPKTEEPKAEEPKAEEPKAEEPKTEQPAADPDATEAWESAAVEPPESAPETLLSHAHLRLASHDYDGARELYEKIVERFPDSDEAAEAARMLSALTAPAARAPLGDKPTLDEPVKIYRAGRVDLYSTKTQERLRLGIFERIDFVATLAGYGVTAGIALAVAIANAERRFGPEFSEMMGGALIGTAVFAGLGLAYLLADSPDRGDLPLGMGITSYIPLTTALIGTAAGADGSVVAAALGVSAIGALPLAYLAARLTDLDPGDTYVVREAGLWTMGMTICFTMVGSRTWFGTLSVDSRVVAGAAVAGLYGGVGLGILAAALTDFSVERARVISWGGYAGTGLGVAFGALASDAAAGFWGAAIGASVGIVGAALLTSWLDEIPGGVRFVEGTEISFLSPSVIPHRDRHGQPTVAFGFDLARGSF